MSEDRGQRTDVRRQRIEIGKRKWEEKNGKKDVRRQIIQL
jgi:hypothetical protein